MKKIKSLFITVVCIPIKISNISTYFLVGTFVGITVEYIRVSDKLDIV